MDKGTLKRLYKARRKAYQRVRKNQDNPRKIPSSEDLLADKGYVENNAKLNKACVEAWEEGYSIDIDKGDVSLTPRKPQQ